MHRDTSLRKGAWRLIVAAMLVVIVGRAEMRSLPLDAGKWFADPTHFCFRADGVHSVSSNQTGLVLYEAAPLAAEVEVSGLVMPLETKGSGWPFAAVAIVQDERNFWHLALVQAPPEQGGRRFVELCEMREGRWLAQENLRQEFSETASAAWEPRAPYRLTISMDSQGVTGTALTEDGRLLLRRRFTFSAPAVTCGRPALRSGGMLAHFSEINARHGPALPLEQTVREFPPYNLTGNAPGIKAPASGFFQVRQMPDGRWWCIDPLGQGTVLLGVDHVSFQGHWCEKLGYAPYGRKNQQKYASPAEWEEESLARLIKWGFNMLGAGCNASLARRGLIHTEFLNIGSHWGTLEDEYHITPNEKRPCSAFPNVFHPDFAAYCRYVARRKCAPLRDDPWLFGYFIDNELAWWGRGTLECGLFDAVMRKSAGHTAKQALRDFLAKRHANDITVFNKFWGTELREFNGVLELERLPTANDEQSAAKYDFLRLVAERYFATTTAAIREVDPNHLVLGARFAGTGGAAPAVWEISGKYCDVVTFNCYPMVDMREGRVYNHLHKGRELITEQFQRYYEYVKRPMLITEWSFPALDANVPSMHGAGQRFHTQAERTAATACFARTMLSQPYLLGYDYFMWCDQPALGISTPFPEDSNYGLVTEDGVPHKLITEMFTKLHADVAGLRHAPPPAARPCQPVPLVTPAILARRMAPDGSADKTFFKRDGSSFSVGNGCLTLTGKTGRGAMIREILLDGAQSSLGHYNAMLQTQGAGGANNWPQTRSVESFAGHVEDGVAVLEIIAAGDGPGGAFRVRHRLWLPPQSPWFIAEVVDVENRGSTPISVKSLFLRPGNNYRALAARQPPNLWGAPSSGGWFDEDSGRYFGAVAPFGSDVVINFWLNPQGGQHPDARLEFAEAATLAPGAKLEAPAGTYIFCVAGQGGDDAWLATIRDLDDYLRSACESL